jgi:hypothetical protein
MIGSSILAYGWHGGRVQKLHKSIPFGVGVAWRHSCFDYSVHFGVWGGMAVA